MGFQGVFNPIVMSLNSLWGGFIDLLPKLLAAIIVFIVGWIIAIAIGSLIERIIRYIKIDEALIKLGVDKPFEKTGWKLNTGKFLNFLVKWFLIIAFLLASVDILDLKGISDFLRAVLLYIPNIVIAVIILIAAILIADFVDKVIRHSIKAFKPEKAYFVNFVAKWAILIFGFFAALVQLGVAPLLINTLITGLVAMLAIAGGLAFGLGGKDAAKSFIEKCKKEMFEIKEGHKIHEEKEVSDE